MLHRVATKIKYVEFWGMIVGSGLLANAFSSFRSIDDMVIFASGVSNSTSTDRNQYDREVELLRKYINRQAKLIYFSTVSVFDPSLSNTEYIKHKRAIEDFIQTECRCYQIYRLPIVVGRSQNPNTLTNFLFQKIINRSDLLVYTGACRYLMDIDDVVEYLTPLIHNNQHDHTTMNIHLDNRLPVPVIIEVFEQVLQSQAVKKRIDAGSCYDVDARIFLDTIHGTTTTDALEYLNHLLHKYYTRTTA